MIAVGGGGNYGACHMGIHTVRRVYQYGNIVLPRNVIHLNKGCFKIVIDITNAFKIGRDKSFHTTMVLRYRLKFFISMLTTPMAYTLFARAHGYYHMGI
jgi:hypothetical protein